jgi:hypothetical protein
MYRLCGKKGDKEDDKGMNKGTDEGINEVRQVYLLHG